MMPTFEICCGALPLGVLRERARPDARASLTRSKWHRTSMLVPVNRSTIATATHAPSMKLVTAAIASTVGGADASEPVDQQALAPMSPRWRDQWTTIPACERVKATNTPTAYRGISDWCGLRTHDRPLAGERERERAVAER